MTQQNAQLLRHTTLTVCSISAKIVPDSRHFIPCQEEDHKSSWYQHWPQFHCGNRLHAQDTILFCQRFLIRMSPSILVYDACYPGARGATPLLQSLLNHCPDYHEAWGINSGHFSLNAALGRASHFILPGHSLIYVHDPLRRLSRSPDEQSITMNILTCRHRNVR